MFELTLTWLEIGGSRAEYIYVWRFWYDDDDDNDDHGYYYHHSSGGGGCGENGPNVAKKAIKGQSHT